MKWAIAGTLLLLVMFVFCLHNFVDTHTPLSLLATFTTGASFGWTLWNLISNWESLF